MQKVLMCQGFLALAPLIVVPMLAAVADTVMHSDRLAIAEVASVLGHLSFFLLVLGDGDAATRQEGKHLARFGIDANLIGKVSHAHYLVLLACVGGDGVACVNTLGGGDGGDH